MISRETVTWEESELQSIANDYSLLQSFQTLKYINVGLLAILAYDYFLTFDLERTRIWTLRPKLPKILFIINRYFLPPIFLFEGYTNVINVGQTICDVRIFTLLSTILAMMSVELMLTVRVLALYENSKYMARFLVIQFFAQVLVWTITAVLILPKARSIPGKDVFTGCLLSLPKWAYLTWLQPIVVEIILVVLSSYKCREYGAFSPTTKILARDSIAYFVIITCVLVFNLVYSQRHILLCTTLTIPTSVLASIAAARLSMNIRSITIDQALSTLTQEGRIVPTLVFRSPHSFNYATGESFSDDVERMPQEDDSTDNQDPDQILELKELYITAAAAAPTS